MDIPLAFLIVLALVASLPYSASTSIHCRDQIPMVPRVCVVRGSQSGPYRGACGGLLTVASSSATWRPTFLIMFTAFIAQAILLEASLSFLGLGVTEPTPAWGLMLSGNAADFYREAPWMILFPGAAISLAVFAFNLFGDALRDYLDPRFKT
jgi:peptide/nickel transport system permease protein